MFEILATICLSAADNNCVAQILPSSAIFQNIAQCEGGVESQLIFWNNRLPNIKIASSECVKRPNSPLEFTEIAKGIFVHKGEVALQTAENLGDVSNYGFVVGNSSVAVIDTGGSFATGINLYLAIHAQTDLPISHVILTHMHPDHVFGASVFEAIGAQVIGHASLERALEDRAASYHDNYLQSFDEPIRSLSILPMVSESPPEIDIGGRVLQITQHSDAHTHSDVSVIDHNTGTLFVGDLLFDEHIPVIDGNIRGWQNLIAEFSTETPLQIIAGHGRLELNAAEAWKAEGDYLDLLAQDTKIAIDSGERLQDAVDTIGQSARANWKLFDEFNARNATVTYIELEWE